MATLPIIRYKLDKTGINPDNYISGELHTLATGTKRATALTYGAYFTQSLRVYDNASNALLVRGTDYDCVELLPTPTASYGKEICYLILIKNAAVSSTIRINYQALGGDYNNVPESLVNMYNLIQALQTSGNVNWPSIVAKPGVFSPGPHLHDLDDLFGFEYLTSALESIRNAILISDSPAYENILAYIDSSLVQYYQTVNIRLDNVANPSISNVSGNTILRYADGLYVGTGTPGPAPAPSPTVAGDMVGAIIGFGMNAAPSGFIKANGAIVSRTTYASLFVKYGTIYGIGDGSTTFKLPDYRGIWQRGWDDGRGVDSGRVFGVEQLDAFKEHSHTFSGTMQLYGQPALGAGVLSSTGTSSVGLTGGTETRTRNNTVLFCIKY